MTPTTRSASKKTRKPPAPSGPSKTTRVQKRMGPAKDKGRRVDAEPLRCLLLELPPEIRNRIYSFCKEDELNEHDFPCPLRKSETSRAPRSTSSRRFFSLTQTCRQICIEYRPLWLRQSSVLIAFEDVQDFISTFYRIPGSSWTWYRDAPRALSISWDHFRPDYSDRHTLVNIQPLLKLRAYSPLSRIRIVPRRLSEHDLPCTTCDECRECINGGHDDSSDESQLYDNHYLCSHEDTREDVRSEVWDEYAYLHSVNDILNHKDDAWLKAVRKMSKKPTTVQCTMGEYCRAPTIHIHFDRSEIPQQLRTRNMYRGGAAYLTDMGIMDLESRPDLKFVVGASTGQYMRSTTGAPPVTIYNQTLIRGSTYKPPTVKIKSEDETLTSMAKVKSSLGTAIPSAM